MLIYFVVFAVALVYHLYSKGDDRKNNLILGWIFAYYAIFIGLGDMIGGYDRYIYGESFDMISDVMSGNRDFADLFYLVNGYEYGYFLWEMLVSLVTRNRYVFILITTILMYVLYFRAFKRYINDYPVAVIVFLGLLFYFSITYLRQMLAVGIVWQGIRYVWERKPFYYFGIVLIATSFHNSALVALPLYFLPIRKHSINQIVVVLAVSAILGLTTLPNMIISAMGDAMDMTKRTESYVMDEIVEFRFDYLLEVIVFLWIIFKNYSKIETDKASLTFLNMTIALCALFLFFSRFGQGGRFGWYFMFGIIYLFSELSTNKQVNPDLKRIVIAIAFALFTRITILWAFNLTPYKTFLTPGYPAGERYIYEVWEYDDNYTRDKFYR